VASYYKTIDGIRYDRSLLELAERLTAGRGDGRISQEDAEQLWERAQDGSGATVTELRTLRYLLEIQHFTDAARAQLQARLPSINSDQDYLKMIRELANEFGAERLDIQRFLADEIQKQEQLPGNQVKFEKAIRTFFELLFTPSDEQETPYHIILNVYELYPGEVDNAHELIRAKLREHLSHGVLWLVPEGVEPDPAADTEFNPAENGEKVSDNWVFYLELIELSDHLYWGIIPRDGSSQPYLYGFN